MSDEALDLDVIEFALRTMPPRVEPRENGYPRQRTTEIAVLLDLGKARIVGEPKVTAVFAEEEENP